MRHIEYHLNPTGSKFSYDELVKILRQNIGFIESSSGHTFGDIKPTTDTRGTFNKKVISFLPPDDFSPKTMAMARAGINFNTKYTDRMNLAELRGLALHEMGHNVGLNHTDKKESVMSLHKFRSPSDKSLLWRRDIIKMGGKVGVVSVDEDLSVMIPSVWWNGKEWAVKLKRDSRGIWYAANTYEADDDVNMDERAFLRDGDILELEDVCYLGITFPRVVRFQITPSLNFELIQ